MVKTKIKLNKILSLNDEMHELFLEIIIDYAWPDQRFDIFTGSMRLPYNKVESSSLWRPGFDFENAAVTKISNFKFIHINNNEVSYTIKTSSIFSSLNYKVFFQFWPIKTLQD